MSFEDAIGSVFLQYLGFKGRARRSEFWLFFLFVFVMNLLMTVAESSGILSFVFNVVVVLPSFAVTVRRLHDTGRAGFWISIVLIPIVGGIILLVFYCQDSQPGVNQWGENPKRHAKINLPSIFEENDIRCKFCGSYNDINAKNCAICGKRIVVYKPMKNNCKNVDGNFNVKEKADTNSDLEVCPKCGSKIRHGRRFCDNCGVKLEDSAID